MKQIGFTLTEAVTVAAIIGILVSIPVGASMSCGSKAKAMNMRSDWGPIQGCMIETKPGQWTPIENYRVL